MYIHTQALHICIFLAEKHMAKLMRAKRALCVSSGMTALDVILRLLRTGDEIIAGRWAFVCKYTGVLVSPQTLSCTKFRPHMLKTDSFGPDLVCFHGRGRLEFRLLVC